MKVPRPHGYSEYIEFSKLRSSARFNLATSGVMNCSIFDLHLRLDDLDIHGPTIYGYRPLLETIAQRKGVAWESVVHTHGTGMANHLAMSTLFAPGDEVLIEEPTYEPLLKTALYLGAKVRRFQRRVEENYSLDPEEIVRNITPQTRLIVLTNLHNPSSSLASEKELSALGELANQAGARVLVDEVYLEALHNPPEPTSFHLGKQFVVTSSLSKAYGLSGLRCGWILAEPGLAECIWRLNDLLGDTPVHIAELLSEIAFEQIHHLTTRADAIIDANRNVLRDLLAEHPAIEMKISPVGTTAFPRLRQGNGAEFCDFLRQRYETSVVPGRYFERPEHFRIGLGGEAEMTREGLVRLAEALAAWK
jgi:aspartate/methionine/tyrosine aminotransferase